FPRDHADRCGEAAPGPGCIEALARAGDLLGRADAAPQRPGAAVLGNSRVREAPMASGGLTRELWAYMRARKKWWLAPIIIAMLLIGALVVFAEGSALAPFIYTIF